MGSVEGVGAQKSLCNRSFLLFPRERGRTGSGRGGSRFQVDGVDGARVAAVQVQDRPGGREPLGNGKGRWVGARVCLNRDLRNLSLEFPVKD